MKPRAAKNDVSEIFDDDELVAKALKKGVMDALRRHKLAGNPVCEWRDGKVVWIAPEDIKIDDE